MHDYIKRNGTTIAFYILLIAFIYQSVELRETRVLLDSSVVSLGVAAGLLENAVDICEIDSKEIEQ